jgi:hypothetical protein
MFGARNPVRSNGFCPFCQPFRMLHHDVEPQSAKLTRHAPFEDLQPIVPAKDTPSLEVLRHVHCTPRPAGPWFGEA